MNKSDKGALAFYFFGRKNLKHWLKNGIARGAIFSRIGHKRHQPAV